MSAVCSSDLFSVVVVLPFLHSGCDRRAVISSAGLCQILYMLLSLLMLLCSPRCVRLFDAVIFSVFACVFLSGSLLAIQLWAFYDQKLQKQKRMFVACRTDFTAIL